MWFIGCLLCLSILIVCFYFAGKVGVPCEVEGMVIQVSSRLVVMVVLQNNENNSSVLRTVNKTTLRSEERQTAAGLLYKKRRVVQRDGVGPTAPPWFIPTFFCSFPLKVYTQSLDPWAAFCSTVDRKPPQELLKAYLSGIK